MIAAGEEMEGNMKKRIRLFAAAALLCLGIGQTALAAEDYEEPVRSGKCGADITWEIQTVKNLDGVDKDALVLTGSGAMDNYLKKVSDQTGYRYEAHPPWEGITLYGITLDDGITTIGDGAFWGVTVYDPYQDWSVTGNYSALVLPENLTTIGKLAFSNADIGSIYMGPKVTKIGEEAFLGASLNDLYVANPSLNLWQSSAVFDYSTLKTIHAPKGSQAETDAKAHNIAFEEWDGIVPASSYTVTLDANGGAFGETRPSARYQVIGEERTKAVVTVSAKSTSVYLPDVAPTLAGKYFGGWYLNDTRFDFNSAISQDTILKAKWLDAPATPELTLQNENDTVVILRWDCAADTDIKEYRIYRADSAEADFTIKQTFTRKEADDEGFSWADKFADADVINKWQCRYRLDAVYENDGSETVKASAVRQIAEGELNVGPIAELTGGRYVSAKIVTKDKQEVKSLTLHVGESSQELHVALQDRSGGLTLVEDVKEVLGFCWALGRPYPESYASDSVMMGSEPDPVTYAYARFPNSYLHNPTCTRLKGLQETAGERLYLYAVSQNVGDGGRLTKIMIPVTIEAAEEGANYPSYEEGGVVFDDLQKGLQVLRDAVRDRVNDQVIYIKKSACDPSIEAYNALRAQDKSDNPSGNPLGGLIPEWMESEVYDINKNRPGMKAWEGDYAYYAIRQQQSYADFEYPVNIYGEEYYKLVFNVPKFTTTVEQEAAVDAKVEQLLSGRLAVVKGKSEYARAKAVYDYVSASMHYDDSDPVYHYAYGGLCKGKATCMGSALSFQRLASELGLESKVIMGMDAGAHTYNLVKIQGKYYYLDCTAGVFLKGKSFRHAPLQDRYLSTAFQTYYMANIADTDYVAGQESTLGSTAIRALTDEEIKAVSNGAYTGIAERTRAKYAIQGSVIQVTPYDKTQPLKPVYDANADTQNEMLAFRLTIDPEKLDDNGTVRLVAKEGEGETFTKANSTLKDGYVDVLCPIDKGEISIAIDYDTEDESASRYEAVNYTMDLSKLVRAAVRPSGTVKERTDALAETGIEISSPTISYRNGDKEVTAVYDAVAYSSSINKENTAIAETAGNYAALRISAPEAMLGTAALGNTTAAFTPESDGCTMKWGAEKTYLDCYCKMEAGKDKILTITWAGKETRRQTVTLRAPQDCYLEGDGAGKDVAKKVAFNGLPSTLYVGQNQIADVKVTRAYEKDEVQLSFVSDDSNVLSVNRVTGEMKALRPGKVTLTVRAAGLDAKGKVVAASKKITVKPVPAPAGIKITDVKDVCAAATWKKNANSRWTEGYAVPYTASLGNNAKAWKAAVEAALTEAGLDNGMAENMTDEQRQALEAALSEALCSGVQRKVVTARAETAEGRLDWSGGLSTNTAYVFYVRNMTVNAAGEVSYAGWMSGKITTKMPVLTKIRLTAYGADGKEAAFNDENGGYSYTDPTGEMLPAEVRYELSAANAWENDKDVYKSPAFKSTDPKVVKVSNRGKLSLGGQAGTAEIYVTGKDSGGAVRESNRIRITVMKSLQVLKDKTTTLMLGQPVTVQELVGCDVKGVASAFKLDRVDLAALVDELESEGKDCFTVTYPAGEKEKAVITPFAYPVDTKSGERKKGASLTVPVKLYDKAGEGRQLVDTKNVTIKVNDMAAPAISKTAVLDTSVDITVKPNTVVREIDGTQYYYTLTLTNKTTGEGKTYRALSSGNEDQEGSGNTFAYEPLYDKKGQLTSWRCTINGLTSATVYEAMVTAHYLPTGQPSDLGEAASVQKASGNKRFTTLKPVIAAENSLKVSLISMEALWADANAAGSEITHDGTVTLQNGQTYVLFAEIGDYDRVMGTDRIKWSVTSDPKTAAAIKASSDSYTANLTLSRCGTVRVQAVSTLSKKVVCSFTVDVKPYQSDLGSAQTGGIRNED